MTRLTTFPVTVVGSWPRPQWLLDALRKKREGQISDAEFQKIADEAVLLAIKYQEDAGIDIVTDGEQRRDNFYSFVADRLEGIRLVTVADLLDTVRDRAKFEDILRKLDVPSFSIRNPVAFDKVEREKPLVLDDYRFLRDHHNGSIKVTLPGPYLLSRSSFIQGLSLYYNSREELAADIVVILRNEIRELAEAGVEFIQLDEPSLTDAVYGEVGIETFMCAALLTRMDPKEELETATRLVNETVKGISGVKLGMHVCRGNWSRKEDVLLKGNYEPLVPYLVDMKIDQLVLEFATPRAGSVEVFKEYPSAKELGLGVVNPRSDEVETPDEIVNKVKEALKYFDPDKIFLNPDCGFGTFSEVHLNTPERAFMKLKSIVAAAKTLRKEYGE